MKIIYRVGEKLLPSWLRAELRPVLAFAGAGTALWTGSVALTRLAWASLRERLTIWESIGALAIGAYVAGYGCWHAPHIARFAVPGTVLAWCAGAWWASPAIDEVPTSLASEGSTEHASAAAPKDVQTATLEWIWQQIGDRQGVHLRDLLDHAQVHGMFEGLDVTTLRANLERHGFPVKDRVRVRGLGVTVGIHRDDLPPLPEPLPDRATQDPPESELHPA